jgi:N-acyl-D-amino-acid deacylase
MYDLIIRNGTIVDGTGAEPFKGDIAIQGNTIAAIGNVEGEAQQEIDAQGKTVTPGFVDIHTHYDGQVTWDPLLSPSSNHGVTTVVFGNCGVGFAPVKPGQENRLIELMEGVEDIPGSALSEGIDWTWETFPEYLDAVEQSDMCIDVGAQVPHAPVRTYVMGERGANNEPASKDDIDAMTVIVKEGIAAGALGFSTSRTIVHKALDGTPMPGTFAAEDEIFGIGRALEELGEGIYEFAPAGSAGEDIIAPKKELDLMVRLSKQIGRPVSFALLQVEPAPDLWRELMDLSADAVADGAQVFPQISGRPFGMLMGLQTTVHPLLASPTYQSIAHLPLAERVAALRQDDTKAQILSELSVDEEKAVMNLTGGFGKFFPMGNPPNYEPAPEESIEELAKVQGCDPMEMVYDTLLLQEGKELILYPLLNYAEGSCEPIYEMLHHPRGALGLGDGGAHCGVICDASIPTFMLTHWVRDRTRGARLPIEFAVKRMTKDTADLYGLGDRGTLQEGMKADINIIDMGALTLHSPEVLFDLPAGGKRLFQDASGYCATIVSGEVILQDGKPTGAQPGKLIRGARNSHSAAA